MLHERLDLEKKLKSTTDELNKEMANKAAVEAHLAQVTGQVRLYYALRKVKEDMFVIPTRCIIITSRFVINVFMISV